MAYAVPGTFFTGIHPIIKAHTMSKKHRTILRILAHAARNPHTHARYAALAVRLIATL
jgi:hypothetical protein